MLLPSDVARLVLGYLQQEGLSATSRAFICESPNLQEYAEHSSEDGIIPACMFSLFGKNLITILNEYVAVKSKETSQENQIPVVMASLWKKLDFTLNQIKSMQNSPALQMNQRLRTKHHIQSMTHQPRPISASQSPGHLPVASSVTSQCVPSPLPTPQGMLGHSTPVSYTSQYSRPSTLCLTQIGESPLQILVPDHRLNPGPLSPARRKCDSPRRRGGGQMGASGTCRSAVVSSAVTVETANEESVAENLSQKVIENAREKILNDRSLQEKLAENINKILASDNSPQTSKVACSTIEQEQSIDEILGLQGEIHMTDDAIQDILAQTESDPAFQALFDLFDYGKSKSGVGGEEAEESFTISVHESDETGHIDSASETGITQEDPGSCSESARNLSLSSSESKNKKKSPVIPKMSKSSSTALQPRLSKQTGTARGSTHLKKGLVRSRVLSDNKQTTVCTKLNNKTDCCPPHPTESSSCFTEEIVVMETDDPQDNTSENVPSLVPQGSSVITINQCDQLNQVSNKPHPASIAEASGEQTRNNLDITGTSMCAIQSQTVPSVYLSEPDVDVSILTPPQSSNKTSPTSTFTQLTDLTQPCCLSSIPSTAASPSLVSSAITSDTSTLLHSQTKEPDPSKILSLKIILSDEQDGQLSDVALNQAVSSITSDRIPTIFLSSPAKSPAKTLSTVITHEETAQAVNILQGMEGVGSFGTPKRNILSNAQATVARPVGQETGFIQLLPANTSYGSPASYFVVTDPASTEQRSNIVLLPKSLSQGTGSSTPHVIATPPRQRTVVSLGPNVSQTYTPGSTIIISSPVQPMLQNVMLPLSVVGQNTGKLTVVPNQMLSLPCPTAVRQPAKVVSQPNVALREKTDMGKTVSSGPVQVSKILSQTSQISDQPSSGTSPSHRRILHFDTSSDNSTAGQNSSNLPSPLTQKNKDKQTEPKQPTVSDTSKRRIEPIRVPEGKSNVPSQTTESHKKRSDQTAVSGRTLNKTANESQVRDDGGKASQSAKSAQDQKQKPASTTKTPEEPSDERPKPADKMSSQYTPCVTANKENELEGCQQEQRLPENLQSSMVKPPIPVSISSAKILCKTSPLTKQAVEMLHDIKGQTPPRKQHNSISSDLPRTPGAGLTQEEVTEGLRTPVRHRHGREGESTPRCLPPPVTPDVPSCSPASEAGSENSINMAAHTLMILSRAARTGGPLKDSLRQEEVSPGKCSVPKAKKRKHIEPSPQAKKELQLSGSSSSKKKSKKQKKLLDSFPDDLDVDKFLSSLHYDE